MAAPMATSAAPVGTPTHFFSNAAGIPIADQPNKTWGASFGGKIWIPQLYDGKNKTFFFLGC